MILSTIKRYATNLKIHQSWFIFFFLIIWSLEIEFSPTQFLFSTHFTPFFWYSVAASGFFISVLLHVSGHLLVEKAFDLPMNHRIIFPFGCIFTKQDKSGNSDALISVAIAGPVANSIAAAAFHLLYLTGIDWKWPYPAPAICQILCNFNLLLTGINLLPIPPFDGGVVFQNLVTDTKEKKTAEKFFLSGKSIMFLAVASGIFSFSKGLVINGFWCLLAAMCISEALQCDNGSLQLKQFLKEARVENFMRQNPVTVQADISLHHFVNRFMYRYHTGIFPVMRDHNLIGFILTSSIKKIPKCSWNSYSVANFTIPCSEESVITSSTTLLQAIKNMYEQSSSRLLVMDYNEISGVITPKDFLHYFPLQTSYLHPTPSKRNQS